MRISPFVLASAATLAIMNFAKAQGYSPYLGGAYIGPGYIVPGYVAPGYGAPSYVAPGYIAPGYTTPGYMWREQRANADWRNNTWRERRFDQDWRNNNWRTDRAMEDWQRREIYEKQRTPNNAADRGFFGTTTTDTRYAGECAVGSSEETCRNRGQRYNPPKDARDRGLIGSDAKIITGVDREYKGECPIGMPLETCRARGLRINPPNNVGNSGTVGQSYTTPGYILREQRPNPAQDEQPHEVTGAIGATNPNAGIGECAIGFSEETCRRRRQKYIPPRQN